MGDVGAAFQQAHGPGHSSPPAPPGGRIEDHHQLAARLPDALRRRIPYHAAVIHLPRFNNISMTLRLPRGEYLKKSHNITDFRLMLLLDIDIAAVTFTNRRVSDEYGRGGQSLPFDLD
jgi:hypothetical protein